MNNKCTSIMKLALCCILGLAFLVGCGVDSKTLPKITSLDYQMSKGRIVANASDDVKVTGYLLTYSNDEPKIEDESWQESSIFEEVKVGNAKVWVKDADGNLAYGDILIEDPVVLLAKDYEFLAWHLDESTSKTVDGVSYDLTALKQKYGDLYRFVEPLSKDDVEYRFLYLAKFYDEQFDIGIYPGLTGIKDVEISHAASEALRNATGRRLQIYEPMGKQELGDEFKMFSKYYQYLDKCKCYVLYPPDFLTMDYRMIDNLESINFDDKNWFVRYFMHVLDVELNSYKELDIIPTFVISSLD